MYGEFIHFIKEVLANERLDLPHLTLADSLSECGALCINILGFLKDVHVVAK